MSIEKRAGPLSRSFRSLIKTRAALTKTIKDLKDLRALHVCACYRHSGPTDLKRIRAVFSGARAMARDRPSPYGERELFSARSAGACPPRALGCARHGEAQALALRGKEGVIFFRSAGPSDATRASEWVSPASVGLRGRYQDIVKK